VLITLILFLVYVLLRTGPFAPVKVTLIQVQYKSIQPSLFGIATVEARHNYKIGPTTAGRLKNLRVDIGDAVQAGQLLGEMDPVDLEEKYLRNVPLSKKSSLSNKILKFVKSLHSNKFNAISNSPKSMPPVKSHSPLSSRNLILLQRHLAQCSKNLIKPVQTSIHYKPSATI
jgi:HlyD family secretion protein